MSASLDCLQAPFDCLNKLYESGTPDISLLKLNTLLILRMLTAGLPMLYSKSVNALSPSQMQLAMETEQILTRNLSARISIRTLSDAAGISETSLKNHFRAVFGQNVSSYMREARMAKAKELLTSSKKLSILEIANMVGYENQSKFTEAFQKYTGSTPSAYRKIMYPPTVPPWQ